MNLEQLKDSSKAFFRASQRCQELRRLPNDEIEFLAIPAAVCMAFSIELGLKMIILRAGGQSEGHNLSKLFNALAVPIQEQIVREIGVKMEEFTCSLEAVSTVFVDWRYIHEKESAHLDFMFLSRMAKAIQKIID